jgi:hypothetical protein
MNDQKPIHCARHGTTRVAFVCRHLLTGRGCGFHDASGEGEFSPEAWCDKCQKILDRDGSFTEENLPPSEIAAVCTGCYEEAKERNLLVPSPLRPGQVEVDEEEYRKLVRVAFHSCEEMQERARARWGFHKKGLWYFDSRAKTLRFYDDEAHPSVVADVTIAGSFSTVTKSWQWVWGNPLYELQDRDRLEPVRVFGEVRGIRRLADARFAADEIDGWEVTQIAAYLLDAEAVYRTPMDHLMVFMLLDNFRVRAPRSGSLPN